MSLFQMGIRIAKGIGFLKFNVLAFFVLLLAASCEEPESNDIYISGHVYYSSNMEPINNITVSLKENVGSGSTGSWTVVNSTVTDSTGYYSLVLINAHESYFIDYNSYPNYRGECGIRRVTGILPGDSLVHDIYLDADTLTCF